MGVALYSWVRYTVWGLSFVFGRHDAAFLPLSPPGVILSVRAVDSEGSVLLFDGQPIRDAIHRPGNEANISAALQGRDTGPPATRCQARMTPINGGRDVVHERLFTQTGRAGQCPAPTWACFCRRWPRLWEQPQNGFLDNRCAVPRNDMLGVDVL